MEKGNIDSSDGEGIWLFHINTEMTKEEQEEFDHNFGKTARRGGEYMANIITVCRILCSILLLFYPAFSPAFYILYIVAGFTDMIDGTIARKTNAANEFGARLDTIADTSSLTAG